MTSHYAVDTSIFVRIEKLGLSSWIEGAGRLPILVTDVVWDELVGPEVSEQSRAKVLPMLQAIAGQHTVLAPQTPEAEDFDRLHPAEATSDAGESSIIAFCRHHAETAPVIEDRRALQRAVEELPGREILSLYGFFGALHHRGFFTKDALREFDRLNRQRFPGQQAPLWWTAAI